MPTPRPRPRLSAGFLVLATVLSACSTSGSGPRTSAPFEPVRAADRLRALDRIDTAGRVRYGERSGPMTGRIGYDPYRFRVRAEIPTGRSGHRATFAGIGDRAWVTRGVTAATDVVPVNGPLSLVLRAEGAPSTLALPAPTGGSSWTAVSMFDPARVLDEAATVGARFETARPATVAGSERRGLRAVVPAARARTTGLRRVTVWVDGTGLPVRLATVTAAQGEARYDIRPGQGSLRIAEPTGTGTGGPAGPSSPPEVTGPYATVAETEEAGIPVRVLAAPAERGWTCWKVESDPPFQGLADSAPGGASCVAPLLPDDPAEDRYAIPLTSAAGNAYTLLGLVVPPGADVEFRRFGAEPVRVTAGPTGLALYAGPREPILGLAVVGTPGSSLVCGPAGVDNEAGFVERRDGREPNDDLVGAPWSCLSAADAADLGA